MNEAGDLGGGIRLINSSLAVQNSRFSNNSSGLLGGGMSGFQTLTGRSLQIRGSEFSMNTSNRGGGLFLESERPSIQFEIDSCSFVGNQGLEIAAGLYLFFDPASSSPTFSLTRSEFMQNEASIVGGGFMVEYYGRNGLVTIDSCVFEENIAGAGLGPGGGAAGMYAGSINEGNALNLSRSSFARNAGGGVGAIGVEVGTNGEWDASIQACSFTDNEAYLGGAAMGLFAYQASLMTQIEIEECSFSGNDMLAETGDAYGALLLASSVGAFDATVSRCTFTGNRNPIGGAALSVSELAPDQQEAGAKLVVENSAFTENNGSISVLDFSRDASPYLSAIVVDLNNLTIAENDAIGIRTPDDMPVIMRNSILSNPLKADVELSATSLFGSQGGNLVSDSSMNSLLTVEDTSGVDPLFVGSGEYPYQLQAGSPAVDWGKIYPGMDVAGGDLVGNVRFQGTGVDAGAYESPFIVSVQEQFDLNAALSLYPNPVVQHAQLSLDNQWRGQVRMDIYSLSGQRITTQYLNKDQTHTTWPLDLSHVPSGMYQIMLSNGQQRTQVRLVKS
ncbi:MAG: T9SS type A sorting domain-containing protein [Bacteroidota bacterium]